MFKKVEADFAPPSIKIFLSFKECNILIILFTHKSPFANVFILYIFIPFFKKYLALFAVKSFAVNIIRGFSIIFDVSLALLARLRFVSSKILKIFFLNLSL